MNSIDLIVCLVLALALWNGWRQGFIVQVCSLAAIVIGIWLAADYGEDVGTWLRLDTRFAAAGGFATVLVATLLVVAVAARLVRKLFHFAGFGILDTVLGVAVSVVKYLLVLSALFAAFDRVNADYAWVEAQTIEHSKSYKPVLRLSEKLFPFLEWVGDQVPQQNEISDGEEL
ncbi:CvpA family protein [Alistipes sp.]|uniref:CvpA family protein n=1 Tax=Alistipes sp. TaxID=1872444 RepID=UPI0025C43A37|nr:CvpA family protein [Alistipes sp.]MCI7139850.1 CvpA family protein [Alistipes sp.]MDY5396971.1 CvpA family protein [Alistipes sp.]